MNNLILKNNYNEKNDRNNFVLFIKQGSWWENFSINLV
jgi:hypothetical protein